MKPKLFIGAVIFVGLPLVAWGPNDVPGFLAHPVRLAYVAAMAAIQVVAAIWFPEALKDSGRGAKTVQRQDFTIRWLQLASVLLVLSGPFCDRRDLAVLRGDELRTLGLMLAVPGFVLMLWARAALGRQFSLHVTIQDQHRLVTAGLYRFVRHPRYAGITLFMVGTALVYRSWFALGLAVASFAVLIWRIRDEEALMRTQFGAEWDAYCRRSWRLLPRVY